MGLPTPNLTPPVHGGSVTVAEAMTLNIGNYQSYKVDVGATFPVRPGETVEAAYARAAAFVTKMLDARLTEVCTQLGIKKPAQISKAASSQSPAPRRVG